jgi:xylulokinase
VYLPYTVDAHAPLDDPAARGVFLGLRADHGAAHLTRAVLEGVAFAIRQVRDATLAQGGATAATLTVGGQAHSPLWNQIKADVLGIPILVPGVVEAGALGAACLAAAGSDYFPSMWEAAASMVSIAQRLEPDPDTYRLYSRLYEQVYMPLYPRIKELFPRLAVGS